MCVRERDKDGEREMVCKWMCERVRKRKRKRERERERERRRRKQTLSRDL